MKRLSLFLFAFVLAIIVSSSSGLGRGQVWAGDGGSKVRVADIDAGVVIATIPTGGTNRSDEVAYDPVHGIFVVANDRDTPPYLTFISTAAPFPILGQLIYDGSAAAHAGNATNGLEQPQFDPITNHFFQAVPATTLNPGGEIDEIDPVTRAVV